MHPAGRVVTASRARTQHLDRIGALLRPASSRRSGRSSPSFFVFLYLHKVSKAVDVNPAAHPLGEGFAAAVDQRWCAHLGRSGLPRQDADSGPCLKRPRPAAVCPSAWARSRARHAADPPALAQARRGRWVSAVVLSMSESPIAGRQPQGGFLGLPRLRSTRRRTSALSAATASRVIW